MENRENIRKVEIEHTEKQRSYEKQGNKHRNRKGKQIRGKGEDEKIKSNRFSKTFKDTKTGPIQNGGLENLNFGTKIRKWWFSSSVYILMALTGVNP